MQRYVFNESPAGILQIAKHPGAETTLSDNTAYLRDQIAIAYGGWMWKNQIRRE